MNNGIDVKKEVSRFFKPEECNPEGPLVVQGPAADYFDALAGGRNPLREEKDSCDMKPGVNSPLKQGISTKKEFVEALKKP